MSATPNTAESATLDSTRSATGAKWVHKAAAYLDAKWFIPPQWQEQAQLLAREGLCARPDVDADAWFPDRSSTNPTGPVVEREQAYARAQCAGCPVIEQCLAYALATGETHGIWGGLTEWERRPLATSRADLRRAHRDANRPATSPERAA